MTNNRNLFKRPFPSQPDRNARDSKLEEAMNRYGEYLIGFFTRNLGDAHRGEELALTLWNHAHRYFEIEQLNDIGLLLHAGRQILGKEYRRRQARKEINTVELRTEEHDQISTRNFATEDDERIARERFWEIFYGLDFSEQHKEAFWLNEIHGYTITELAERYGVSRSVVHDWMKKLKEKCRKHLTGE
jgi:RNA polymerase sigma factor (sigma-70 family)